MKQIVATFAFIIISTIKADLVLAETLSGSITATRTHQAESLRANVNASMAAGPGLLSASLLLSESPGSGIDHSTIKLSYGGLFHRKPQSNWGYNLIYARDTFALSGLTSETISSSLGYNWVSSTGFSSNFSIIFSEKENLHGQTHKDKRIAFSTTKAFNAWRLGVSAAIGSNVVSVADEDQYFSGSVSLGRGIGQKTYLSLKLSQTNDHQRHYYNETPFDIWMETRQLGLSLKHQLTKKLSGLISIQYAKNKSEYFGHLVDNEGTIWSLSTTYRF